MASQIDICNMALSHLATGVEIASYTERSNEAQACRRFYDPCLQGTLRDFPNWPFATRVAYLGLVTDYTLIQAAQAYEWGYAYRYPSDCLFAKRILSGARQDSRATRVSYRIIGDAAGQLILSSFPSAQLEYTALATDPSVYPADFQLALSLRLAIYIAPRLTAGDQFKLRAAASQLYQAELSRAMVNAANEGQSDVMIESDFIRTRE